MILRSVLIVFMSFSLVWGSLTIVDAYSDARNILTDVNDSGWQIGAQLNPELVYEQNESQQQLNQALQDKMSVSLDDSELNGSMTVTLTELRQLDDTKAISGDGQAIFEVGDYTFSVPFESKEVYQIDHEGERVRAFSLDEQYETANGSVDMINMNIYWQPATDDVYVVGSVGFVTNLAELAFGEPFITPQEFLEGERIEFNN
ncbi:hypothetical protein ABID56_001389 [Alkalibacillus flavidus]|uniref:Uncharacterized protein n=1 Tax=Alkalibacillus flavidus TaxID=546021 RepID=A0ABV2KUN7_9BACI